MTSPPMAPALTTSGPHPGYVPGEWYSSAEVLSIERRRLLDHSWALVATTEELAEPGSCLTAKVGTVPLLVVRDREGAIRAHHNLCRHRGLPLVEQTGQCGRYLTCPYHQWTYDLSGALRRIPQADRQFAGVDPDEWGLLPASVGVWHGMVFANPDPGAPPLLDALGFLAERLEGFLSGPLVEVASVEHTVRCNWKLLVENHLDVYHLWYLHSRSLSLYDHRRFEWDTEQGNWWSLEPLNDPAGAADGGLDWLPRPEREGIGAHLLFPNLMIVTTGSYFATYDVAPLAPDVTRLTLRVRSLRDADGAALVDAVRSFLSEDISICEQLQVGVSSSSFRYGPLAATHEAPIRAFHQTLAQRCQ